MRTSLAWSLVLISTLLASPHTAGEAALGSAVFMNSGAPEAQDAFTGAASGHLCGQRSSYEETSRKDLIVAQVMQDSLH